jgi:alkylated DNA repair dioxygenase AlkB
LDDEMKELLDLCVREMETRRLIGIYEPSSDKPLRYTTFFTNISIKDKDTNFSYGVSPEVPESFRVLLEMVNRRFNTSYNGINVNKYTTGKEFIHPHSDNLIRSFENDSVLGISVGATRQFIIREQNTGTIVANIDLLSYHYYIMGGNFQQEYFHEIPPQPEVTEPRYSFTFRKHTVADETSKAPTLDAYRDLWKTTFGFDLPTDPNPSAIKEAVERAIREKREHLSDYDIANLRVLMESVDRARPSEYQA